MMEGYLYRLDFKVRDYECDLQGIVNNAVYQNYLEHTRHEYLKTKGVDFAEIHREGKDTVVVRVEMDFITSLVSGDAFYVTLKVEQKGRMRLVFIQEVYRSRDDWLMLKGKVTTAVVEKGRPHPIDDLADRLRTA
jgi:acyl-CoA thioester hydrolase